MEPNLYALNVFMRGGGGSTLHGG